MYAKKRQQETTRLSCYLGLNVLSKGLETSPAAWNFKEVLEDDQTTVKSVQFFI